MYMYISYYIMSKSIKLISLRILVLPWKTLKQVLSYKLTSILFHCFYVFSHFHLGSIKFHSNFSSVKFIFQSEIRLWKPIYSWIWTNFCGKKNYYKTHSSNADIQNVRKSMDINFSWKIHSMGHSTSSNLKEKQNNFFFWNNTFIFTVYSITNVVT